MPGDQVFERLGEMFRQPNVLPQLPDSALRLISALDEPDSKASDLSRIISADPALAAHLLRVASSAAYAAEGKPTTVQGAITRLGHRAVRSLAVALVVQALLSRSASRCSFRHQRFARHSTFVALAGRQLFANRKGSGELRSDWTPDEVFAAGVLHDLSIALLARMAPKVHDTVYAYAQRDSESFEATFVRLFEKPVAVLGARAAETWHLPSVLILSLQAKAHLAAGEDADAFRECLAVADALAARQGFAYEDWPLKDQLDKGPDLTAQLTSEDLAELARSVERESSTLLGELTRAA